jgi:HK97 family phage prohead protease
MADDTNASQEAGESMGVGEFVYRATDPAAMRFREESDGGPVLEGRMMPYNEWTEIRSSVEGHFLERFAPGALAKTMSEQAARIRVLFEHGLDPLLGRQAIAEVGELRDEQDGAYYTAGLLEGLPPLLLAGLRRSLYGSSVRYRPVKGDRVRAPKPSEYNPEGIPEVTVREAQLREFSVVTFPQYAGATAAVRSLTDEVAAQQLIRNPTRFLELMQTPTTTTTEPQHSDEEPNEAPEPSRRTQPTRDYLRPEEADRTWRL